MDAGGAGQAVHPPYALSAAGPGGSNDLVNVPRSDAIWRIYLRDKENLVTPGRMEKVSLIFSALCFFDMF